MYLNRRPILSTVFLYSFSFIPVGIPATVGRDPDVNQCHLTQMYGPLLCVSRCRLDFGPYDKVKQKVQADGDPHTL